MSTVLGVLMLLIIPAIIAIVGLVLGWLGWSAYRDAEARGRWAADAVETDATILDTREEFDANVRASDYFVRVRFETEEGRSISGEAKVRESLYRRVATDRPERIPVVYYRADPEQFAGPGVWQEDRSNRRILAAVMLPWGLAMVLAGVYLGYRWLR